MSPASRRLVRTIVFEAFNRFEADPEARKAFLCERCHENPELLPVAMEEIEAEEKIRRGQFLDKPAAASLFGVIPEGTLIGEYRIGTLIGEGAMGAVYRARQVSLDRDVAVKTLRTPLATQAGLRFLSEAKTLSRIASARVIHVYGYGDYNGQPYIAMELGEGTNLAQLIAERSFPDINSRLAIALQIAEGLEQIHLANIAHRDVKPSNVLVDGKGNVKLIDFGIAWREDSRMTEIGQALGTPAYMPPEQILRHLGGSATDVEQYKWVDIYSFGILLYELFTGELPFRGETRGEVEWEIVHAPVLLDPLRDCQVPEGVVELIRLATSKNPAARPRSFGEVVNVLRIYIADPQARPVDKPVPRRSNRVLLAAAGILAAAVTVAGVYQVRYANPVRPAALAHPPGAPPIRDLTTAAEAMRPISIAPAPGSVLKQPPARDAAPPSNMTGTSAVVRQPAVQASSEPKHAEGPATPLAEEPRPERAASGPATFHDILPDAPPAVESPEDREWERVRETNDIAALQAFWKAYSNGRHAAEARKIASGIEYQAVKNSNHPEALENFAQKYPEHPFAASASSLAHQLKARAAASAEINETLKGYAAAMQRMKLAEVQLQRELDKQAKSKIEKMFSMSRSVVMKLTPAGPPQFGEPVVADPAATHEIPSHAVVESEYDMLVVSGGGEAHRERHHVTVQLKRTGKGWIITSI